MYYLYTLNDENDIPKYIGVTNDPKERLHGHLNDHSNSAKVKWIESMRKGGNIPKMVICRQTESLQEVLKWEKEEIKRYKYVYNLTNSTDGGEYPDRTVTICAYDMKGNFYGVYSSMTEFCELHGWSSTWATCISSVCLRKRQYHKNFIFRYLGDSVTKDDLEKLEKTFHNRDPKHFFIMSLDGDVLGEFNSLQEAEKAGFGSQESISKALKNWDGFISVKGNLIVANVDEFQYKKDKYLKNLSKNTLSVPINKYDLQGNYIESFYTCVDACKSIESATNPVLIKKVCDGLYKQAYGYLWKLSTNKDNIPPYTAKLKRKANTPINQYSLSGEFIKTWNSRREAADTLNISFAAIYRCLCGDTKSSGGYIWKFNEAV